MAGSAMIPPCSLLDEIGLVPIIGAVKYSDEVAGAFNDVKKAFSKLGDVKFF